MLITQTADFDYVWHDNLSYKLINQFRKSDIITFVV